MTSEINVIIEKLNHIETDLHFIKQHISDVDLVLTQEDMDSLRKAEQELKEGKTKRLI